MKKEFSTSWTGSRQTRKQRKYRANAPLHIKHKFMAANLSKELRKKQGSRNLEIRKGDVAKVMRGKFSGKSGKVSLVDLKKERIAIEGLQRQKKDGTKINVFFSPSKVQITELEEGRKGNTKAKTEEKRDIADKNQKETKNA